MQIPFTDEIIRTAALWNLVKLLNEKTSLQWGIELHFDTDEHNPQPEPLQVATIKPHNMPRIVAEMQGNYFKSSDLVALKSAVITYLMKLHPTNKPDYIHYRAKEDGTK